jgi:hypothetical protein
MTRANFTSSFFYVLSVHILAWVYGWVVQEQYTANPPSYDWSDKGFAKGMFVIILWRKNLVPRMSIGIFVNPVSRIRPASSAKLALLSSLYYDRQHF